MTEIVDTAEQLAEFVATHPATVLYFSANDCTVCQVLLPKVETLLQQEFPRAGLGKINCSERPKMAAQHGVFTVPSLILYFEGRETRRFSRNISLGQLREALARPYQLLFE